MSPRKSFFVEIYTNILIRVIDAGRLIGKTNHEPVDTPRGYLLARARSL